MRSINGYTRTCGLLGNPVEHTLSPVIHNFLAEKMGEGFVYVPFRVQEDKLAEAVKGAFALNLLGLNVTVPYKSAVIPYLQELDPLAERIGAVNTLVRCEKGFKGYNTDMPGLYRAMCADGVRMEGVKALLLGAGGVAKAAAMLLAQKGADSIVILNRTLERAAQVADTVNQFAGRRIADAMMLTEHERLSRDGKYLAIQATNLGMFPDTAGVAVEDESFYDRIDTGYDLIFNPWETKFMKLVKSRGGRAFNGSKMLLYQGIIAYELWTGRIVEEPLAEAAYQKMMEAMKL